MISDKIIVSSYRGSCMDGLSLGCIHTQRTIESALDQTLRAQSHGIAGIKFRVALGTVRHLAQSW